MCQDHLLTTLLLGKGCTYCRYWKRGHRWVAVGELAATVLIPSVHGGRHRKCREHTGCLISNGRKGDRGRVELFWSESCPLQEKESRFKVKQGLFSAAGWCVIRLRPSPLAAQTRPQEGSPPRQTRRAPQPVTQPSAGVSASVLSSLTQISPILVCPSGRPLVWVSKHTADNLIP